MKNTPIKVVTVNAAILIAVGLMMGCTIIDRIQLGRQMKTMSDMQQIGYAYFSFFADSMGAASAGSQKTHMNQSGARRLTQDEILADLHPSDTRYFLAEIPWEDAWGHPFEVWRNDGGFVRSILIRSPGSDGVFEGDAYDTGPYLPTDYDNDIVWHGGYFIRYSEAAAMALEKSGVSVIRRPISQEERDHMLSQ